MQTLEQSRDKAHRPASIEASSPEVNLRLFNADTRTVGAAQHGYAVVHHFETTEMEKPSHPLLPTV